jgi:hypothetical protein
MSSLTFREAIIFPLAVVLGDSVPACLLGGEGQQDSGRQIQANVNGPVADPIFLLKALQRKSLWWEDFSRFA